MPVLIDIDQHDHHLFARAPGGSAAEKAPPEGRIECLDIGLINNMPDSALIPTERQLFDLLDAAAGKLVVRLHFYTLETTPRSEWGRDYVRRYYRGTDDLLNAEPGRNHRDGRRTESRQADGRAVLDHLRTGRRLGQREYRVIGVLLSGRPWSRPAHRWRGAPRAVCQMHRRLRSNEGRRSPLDARPSADFQNTARAVERGAGGGSRELRVFRSRQVGRGRRRLLREAAEQKPFRPFPGPPGIRCPELVGRIQEGHGPFPPRRERSLPDDTERLFQCGGGSRS